MLQKFNAFLKPLPAVLAALWNAPTVAGDDVPGGLGESEWPTTAGATEAIGYAIHQRADGTYGARNPGQQWHCIFDGHGFLVVPDHGLWIWGMALQTCQGRPLASARSRGGVDGNKLRYRRNECIEEWFLNDERGLEQGWTLAAPPVGCAISSSCGRESWLSLGLALRGNLSHSLSDDCRRVDFLTADGATALTFGGLKAWDSEGKSLEVRFTAGKECKSLGIVVDDTEATYPITIDPIARQSAYLKPSYPDGATFGDGDLFGTSVAVDGNTLVVGSRFEDSAAMGVNGQQDDNSARDSGAAYVFVFDGTVWRNQAYLKASNTGAGDAFGSSVGVSGDTIVIGAPSEDSTATGVNGDQGDDSGSNCGAVYVFVRDATGNWMQQAYLKASNTDESDFFGGTVAISGDTIIVGASREDGGATGVNGNEGDNSMQDAGAGYIFVRNDTEWTQQAYLKASNTGSSPGFGDNFGEAVGVDGDLAVVGASSEDSAASEINGNGNDNSAQNTGAAYVFVRDGGNWTQEAYLKAANSEALDQFGGSVAVSGNTVVVGAALEDGGATSVNGDSSDNGTEAAGAAYIFVRDESGRWTQESYLKPPNPDVGDYFGWAVGISGDFAVVGAFQEDGGATGINGDGSDNRASNSGAAYVFVRNGTTWSQQAYFKASTTDRGGSDRFGRTVAISRSIIAVGSPYEDSAARGINGNQDDDEEKDSGAAYAFDLSEDLIRLTDCFLDGTTQTLRFCARAGVTNWNVMGSTDLQSFLEDRTVQSSISDLGLGEYEAVVDVTGLPNRYFLRIEP